MSDIKQKRISEILHLVFYEMQDFRNKLVKIFFGFIGIESILCGWIITSEFNILYTHKVLLIFFIAFLFIFYSFISKKLKKYFLHCAKTINKIDKYYGFYNVGEYIENDTILPKEWENFGNSDWIEPIFPIAWISVLLMSIISILLILTTSTKNIETTNNGKNVQQTIREINSLQKNKDCIIINKKISLYQC